MDNKENTGAEGINKEDSSKEKSVTLFKGHIDIRNLEWLYELNENEELKGVFYYDPELKLLRSNDPKYSIYLDVFHGVLEIKKYI